MAPAAEQGYSVSRLLDSNNVECFVVPSYGGVVGVTATGQPEFTARVAITSAQLLALHTTPIQLTYIAPVPLYPAVANNNWIIIPKSISLHYLYATAAYTTTGGTMRVSYGPVANAVYVCADQSAILGGIANAVLANIAISTIASQTDAVGLAQNLYLVNPGTNFTVGGGSLVVGITYNIITL